MRDATGKASQDAATHSHSLEFEVEAHHQLIMEGCHPLYPLSLVERVCRDPESYRQMLLPFWNTPPNYGPPWMVFTRQLKRWRQFSSWQGFSRGVEDGSQGYQTRVEAMNGEMLAENVEVEASIKASPRMGRADLEDKERGLTTFKTLKHWQLETKCNGWDSYEEAVKSRLARHGFTRGFQLHQDAGQQDQLTTWIEYLGFEYWWLERYARIMNRYTKAWHRLKKTGLLEQHETRESIRGYSIQAAENDLSLGLERKQQENSRFDGMNRLVSAHSSHLQTNHRRRSLWEAESAMRQAEREYTSLKKRHERITDFLNKTADFEKIRERVGCQRALIEWVLGRVSLMDAGWEAVHVGDLSSGIGKTVRFSVPLVLDSEDVPHVSYIDENDGGVEELEQCLGDQTPSAISGSAVEATASPTTLECAATSQLHGPLPRRSSRIAKFLKKSKSLQRLGSYLFPRGVHKPRAQRMARLAARARKNHPKGSLACP